MTRKYDESSIRLLLSERAAYEKVKRSKKRFYVYLIYGGTLGIIYVGKGQAGRFKCHENQAQKFLDANPDLPYTDWVVSGKVRTLPKVQRMAAHLSYAPLRYDFALFTDDEDEAFEREAQLTKFHGLATKEKGHLANRVHGGSGRGPGVGHVFSFERRRKISEALTGRPLSEAHCEKISKALKGRKIPKETRERMAEGQRRRGGLTEAHKKKVSTSRLASTRIKRVRVKIHGRTYSSMVEAAEHSGYSYGIINYALRTNRPGFTRLSA